MLHEHQGVVVTERVFFSLIGPIAILLVAIAILSINYKPAPVIQSFDTNALVKCEQERQQAAFYAVAILRAIGTNHVQIERSTPSTSWILNVRHTSNNQSVVSYDLDLAP